MTHDRDDAFAGWSAAFDGDDVAASGEPVPDDVRRRLDALVRRLQEPVPVPPGLLDAQVRRALEATADQGTPGGEPAGTAPIAPVVALPDRPSRRWPVPLAAAAAVVVVVGIGIGIASNGNESQQADRASIDGGAPTTLALSEPAEASTKASAGANRATDAPYDDATRMAEGDAPSPTISVTDLGAVADDTELLNRVEATVGPPAAQVSGGAETGGDQATSASAPPEALCPDVTGTTVATATLAGRAVSVRSTPAGWVVVDHGTCAVRALASGG